MFTLPAVILLMLLVVMVAVVAIALKHRSDGLPATSTAPFRLRTVTYLFSPAENAFYTTLSAVAADFGLVIFPKVGLCDLFKDAPDAPRGQRNRYSQMRIDFLLATRWDYRPVMGIELQGPSLQGERQQDRDQKKREVFKAAALPLLTVYNQDRYDAQELRARFEDVLGAQQLTSAR